ncbi:acetolactate synthase small subunit [uncultured Veillonella sp.]|uniref:acetolactate synthase small subunit n=1 Tax=uncultured Veillonella sp. TaxID=159268 RepID=UPI002593205D|nr:acetolactate synthase small subunit [uncultured Veillonella sp.]
MSRDHEILIIAKNTPGIGARILSLFNRRGYSVKKMTSGVTVKPGYARLTLTVDADVASLDQIQKQIYKLIDVVKVKVFPDHNVVRRELMLIKVKADEHTRSQIVQIATIYRGNILDVSPTSLIVELTGDTEKLRGFIDIMQDYGVLEIAKTGITAMSRGERM